MLRDDRSFLEEHVRNHHTLPGDQLPVDLTRDRFEWYIGPAEQPHRLGGHAALLEVENWGIGSYPSRWRRDSGQWPVNSEQ